MQLIKDRLRSWRGTSSRTFFVYPAVTLLLELLIRRRLRLDPAGLLLMLWGYAQYRLVGAYLMQTGQGSGYGAFSWSPRRERAPNRAPAQLVTTGPYSITRNPMYTGHVIFMAGLLLATRSPVALLLAAYHSYWLHGRALEDERTLSTRFGEEYAAYQTRVGRWLPKL